jgi:hypothetical protein
VREREMEGRKSGSGRKRRREKKTEREGKRYTVKQLTNVYLVPIQDPPLPENEDVTKVSTLRILRANSAEWPFIAVGTIASVLMGAWMPVYAILFGEVRQ